MPPDSAAETLEAAQTIETLQREIAELRCAHEALCNAERRKDEFLATLAHELRNPLAPLLSALQLMELSPGDVAEVKNLRTIMARQVEQLVRLTEDLLDVSRISRGKLALQREHFQLAEAIEAACDVSRPSMEEAGHELSRSLPHEPLVVAGDKVRIAQIVSNLLINAAKYTPQRGKIDLVVRQDEDRVEIRVRDSGIGIPAEMLPRIFDLFTQVNESKVRSQGGLGIGLALAKSLVEMHGGSIRAASSGEGRGSEFVVRLPLVRHPAAIPSGPSATEVSLQLPTYRILIVDDNAAPAHLISRLLQKLGQHAYTASSAVAGLEAAERTRPDLIISDIAMPEMSGYDLARRIRATESLRDIVLIALTGLGQESDRQEALDAGFDYHLTKPVGLQDLEDLLLSLSSKQCR